MRRFRLPRAGILACASLLLSGLLALLAGALGVPDVTPAEAALFEGQGDVRMAGLADTLHRFAGGWEAQLHRNGTALDLRGQGDPAFQDGDWVDAVGRIARASGRLALLADAVAVVAEPEGIGAPTWTALAQDPAAWDHRPLRLTGWIDHDALRDHDGHAVQLAAGSWPPGPAMVEGYLAYEAACLCHRLHGHLAARAQIA